MRKFLSRLPLFPRFLRREDGTVLVEGVVMLPMLLWAFIGLFVFWDAHKTVNAVQKATYTVSDTLSRRQRTINAGYLTGLKTMMDYLMGNDAPSKLRITSATWVESRNQFEVLWSCSPGSGMTKLTTTTLQSLASNIPLTADGDTVLIVESELTYRPGFNVGIDDMAVRQFVVTRPRAPSVVLTGGC